MTASNTPDNPASLEKPESLCVICGQIEFRNGMMKHAANHEFAPAPVSSPLTNSLTEISQHGGNQCVMTDKSSSPLETPSQPRKWVLGQPQSRLELEDGTHIAEILTNEDDAEFLRDAANAAESSPKPAESPMSAKEFSNSVRGFSEPYMVTLNEACEFAEAYANFRLRTPSPEPPLAKALIDFSSTHDMRWDDLASEAEWGNVMELARNESRIISSCGGSHAETGVAFQSSAHSAPRSASLDAAGQSSPHETSPEPARQTQGKKVENSS